VSLSQRRVETRGVIVNSSVNVRGEPIHLVLSCFRFGEIKAARVCGARRLAERVHTRLAKPETGPSSSIDLVVGLGGAARNACVAVCAPDRVLGICEQERVTRVKAAGVNRTGLPDEALDELLARAGRSRRDVSSYVSSEGHTDFDGITRGLDHHLAHACAAFLPSSFASAAILICDHELPQVSVWTGCGTVVERVDWPWTGVGFAELYSQCASALGFEKSGGEQRMEALARLEATVEGASAAHLFHFDGDRLQIGAGWQAEVAALAGSTSFEKKAAVAAALQARVAELVVQLVADVRRRTSLNRLCVGGSLFYNSHINARIKQARSFDEVSVPINPGNAGLAIGAALHGGDHRRAEIPPFLGPAYTPHEIKATLDNCKLTYKWVSQTDSIAVTSQALQRGQLVAWFDGPMEWGPRALGARSILANPFAPYVLDNLNMFLKQREPWRGYAMSGLRHAVREQFEGPDSSPFMECDYVPRDRARFCHVLPRPQAAVRVHTVETGTLPRFEALLRAFGDATGVPVLVNTSFNGFQEPMVCSPRDAVRVFFGTGIDLLVLGGFVIAK
jgi:carbamoyltransferase